MFAVSDFPNGSNVGVILGPRSGELVDIDLDCAEALALADLYLPATEAIFGRKSKPRSHRIYIAVDADHRRSPIPPITARSSSSSRWPRRRAASNPISTKRRRRRAPRVVRRRDRARCLRHCQTAAPLAWLATACLVSRHVSRHAASALPGSRRSVRMKPIQH